MVNKNKFIEEDAEGYSITIIGRHIQVTEAMKNYAWEKLNKIERFHIHIMDVHLTLDIQGLEHIVDILAKFDHFVVKVQASSTDMYASVDKAIDRLQTKLRRWKGKIQDHNKKKSSVVDMQVNVLQRPYDEVEDINDDIEQKTVELSSAQLKPPKIIGTDTLPLKVLTADEAVMKMELSDDYFMVFRAEEDQKLKVIYRRADGHYGLIQTE